MYLFLVSSFLAAQETKSRKDKKTKRQTTDKGKDKMTKMYTKRPK